MCDGQARTLAFVLTGGQVADTSMFTDVLDEIHVSGRGHARTRPDRVLADKGYPSKKNRAWLRERGIKSTIPERADQIANRRKRPGRPIDFGGSSRRLSTAHGDMSENLLGGRRPQPCGLPRVAHSSNRVANSERSSCDVMLSMSSV